MGASSSSVSCPQCHYSSAYKESRHLDYDYVYCARCGYVEDSHTLKNPDPTGPSPLRDINGGCIWDISIKAGRGTYCIVDSLNETPRYTYGRFGPGDLEVTTPEDLAADIQDNEDGNYAVSKCYVTTHTDKGIVFLLGDESLLPEPQ